MSSHKRNRLHRTLSMEDLEQRRLLSVTIGQTEINPANGHEYFIIQDDNGLTWQQAENKAVEMGGNLASVNSQAENDWIKDNFHHWDIWIGLNDAANEGNFQWSSGEEVTYLNWKPGEPNNWNDEDFVHFSGSGWNDNRNEPTFNLVGLGERPVQQDVVSVAEATNPANNHTYYLLAKEDGSGVTWHEGEKAANDLGGHLITLNSQAENDWVRNAFHHYDIWTGLNDETNEGEFQWSSGDEVTYLNWKPGEPNNWNDEDFVHFSGSGWNDNKNDPSFDVYALAEVEPELTTMTLDFVFTVSLRQEQNTVMEVVRPSSVVGEGDTILTRFTHASARENANVRLIYQNSIVQTASAVVNDDGTANVEIKVPDHLLPLHQTKGELAVVMTCGDQTRMQQFVLQEGTKLILFENEIREGHHFHIEVRHATGGVPVKVIARNDFGKDYTWHLGDTDGSGYKKAELTMAYLLEHGMDRDGIEIDIQARDDSRGYKAVLTKGIPRADRLAQLISTSGTEPIESEASVLLTDQEQIRFDRIFGDDWEGNPAAVSDAFKRWEEGVSLQVDEDGNISLQTKQPANESDNKEEPEQTKTLVADTSLELKAHPKDVIITLFRQAFGREPTSQELSYWRLRTDKSGDALLGAMQFAREKAADQTIGETGGEQDDNSDNVVDGNHVIDPLLSFTIDESAVLNLQSGDSLGDSLLATYGDAVSLNKTYRQISEDTLVVVFYGSNQDPDNSDTGINDLVASLESKTSHILGLTTGKNPFCNEDICENLNKYKEQYDDNYKTILKYLGDNSIDSIIFFGYSWGASMAYDITESLNDSHSDLRILGTVCLDGIDSPGIKSLGVVHSDSESLLNLYQSRSDSFTEFDLLHGAKVVPDNSLLSKLLGNEREYESFDHFYNALGSILEMDMDDYDHGVDHGNIDDNELVLSIAESFILGLLKEAYIQ